MKVLLLNPHVTLEGELLRGLEAHGHAMLLAANVEEARQMLVLHGSSVDLAVIHREGGSLETDDRGLQLISHLKTDPSQADLPFIVTSQYWNDEDFARHQKGDRGANAYLRWPFDAQGLVDLIGAVFAAVDGNASSPESSVSLPTASRVDFRSDAEVSIPTAAGVSGAHELVLEDVSNLFATQEQSETSIRLEAPDFTVEAPSMSLALEMPSLAPAIEPAPESASEPVATVPAMALDIQAEEQMPYLFEPKRAEDFDPHASMVSQYSQPLGDAVVPGGAAHAPDVETLKKYLLLREQDVAVLSSQLKSSKDQIKSLEENLRDERGRNVELSHVAAERERKLADFDREKQHTVDSLQSEITELRFQLKSRTDKSRVLDAQVREATEEVERLKERVRSDIRKIRVREKELENRLEIMKKDSEALISARENKIIELKRRLDLLEFNMDLLQDQHAREKENAGKLRDRLARAAQVVRVAGGLLDSPGGVAQLAAVLTGDEASSSTGSSKSGKSEKSDEEVA